MTDEWHQLSPIKTGLRGLCPSCGQGHLFSGFLTVRPKCDICGADYTFEKPTDRLGLFVFSSICLVGIALLLRIQLAYSPSIWVHLTTALPPVLLICVLPLRPLKGWLVANRICSEAKRRNSAAAETGV